jgi:hypothetical protein
MSLSAPARAFYIVFAIAVAAQAVILVLRVASILRFSALVPAPIEGPGLYAIWKIQHGYPAYEWPTRPPFALALYNALFYHSYARALALLGITDAALPVGAKLLTLVLALGGAGAQYIATRALAIRLRLSPSRAPLWAIALLVWFGAGSVGRWAVYARPDVGAAALAMAALAVVVAGLEKPGHLRLHVASVLFFLAWGFKQSTVGFFAGTCLFYVLVVRSPRALLALTVPFVLLAVGMIAAGGAAFRYDILTAPTVYARMDYWLAAYWYRALVLPNLGVWIAAGAGAWLWLHGRPTDISPWRDRAFSLLLLTMVVTGALDAVLLAKPGSSINHTFEFWFASALFATLVFLVATESPGFARRAYAIGSIATLPTVAFAAALLVPLPRLARILTIGTPVDRLEFGSSDELARRQAAAARMRELPKPIFIDDEILGQPWFATDNRYPAVVLDHVFYDTALAQGRLERDGVASLVDDRRFAAMLVAEPPWANSRAAIAAGYVRAGALAGLGDDDRLAVLLRSENPPPLPFAQRSRPTRRRMP